MVADISAGRSVAVLFDQNVDPQRCSMAKLVRRASSYYESDSRLLR